MTDTGSDEVVWVPFGGSRVELDVASKVFTLLKEQDPELLGEYIGEAMCDVKPRARRRVNGHVRS